MTIRWIARSDLPDVLKIEKASFENPWTEQDFIYFLRQRKTLGMVIECDNIVIGYMVYKLRKSEYYLKNLAIHPDFRRRGFGAKLIKKLVDKLLTGNRDNIYLNVVETNLGAQLFFKAVGFKAFSILYNTYEDTDSAAYAMSFHHKVFQ